VAPTVACDFVALAGDAPHHIWKSLRDPTKNEEGRARVLLRKKIKQSIDIGLHAQLAIIPFRSRDGSGIALGLKPILNVDRQNIAEFSHGPQGSCNCPRFVQPYWPE
jgi:hypothetical protein